MQHLIYEIGKYQFAKPAFHLSAANNGMKFTELCIFPCVVHLRELATPNLISHTHLYVVELLSDFILDPPLGGCPLKASFTLVVLFVSVGKSTTVLPLTFCIRCVHTCQESRRLTCCAFNQISEKQGKELYQSA